MIAERAPNLRAQSATHVLPAKRQTLVVTLLPIIGTVFVAFLVIGLAMPVLPLFVNQGLGFGMFVVGLVAGAQFAVSLVSRFVAGHQADRRGARLTVIVGLLMAAVGGVFYLLSVALSSHQLMSVILLLLGRGVLGGGESFIVAGSFVWGLRLAGPGHTGSVMSWVGAPMYVAYAIGAPIGSLLYVHAGFIAIAAATILLPFVALFWTVRQRGMDAGLRPKVAARSVLRAIALPGIGVAFSSIGLGTISTFAALLYTHQGWNSSWIAFTAMSLAFVLARAFCGHLPDRFGGARVALVCAIVEAAGQALMWLASSPLLATMGAALSGFGYALVYPSLGVEAIRRAPAQACGLASGAYTAFLDVALGVGSPVLGVVASVSGLASVFGAGAILAIGAAIVSVILMIFIPRKVHHNGN